MDCGPADVLDHTSLWRSEAEMQARMGWLMGVLVFFVSKPKPEEAKP